MEEKNRYEDGGFGGTGSLVDGRRVQPWKRPWRKCDAAALEQRDVTVQLRLSAWRQAGCVAEALAKHYINNQEIVLY